MANPVLTWLDDFFGPAIVRIGVFFFPKRPILEFVPGVGVSIDVEDSELHNATVITITRFGGVPGGSPGDVQYYGLDGEDPIFAGTPKLNRDATTGELTHTGKPLHKEAWDDFRDGDGSGVSLARSQWADEPTTNATPTTIMTISVPAATHGDCFLSVHAKVTYAYSSSGTKGGTFSKEATFYRSSGTLTRVDIADYSPAGLGHGTAAGGMDIVASGNDAIIVQATGIAATTIEWFTSLHAQLAVKPS